MRIGLHDGVASRAGHQAEQAAGEPQGQARPLGKGGIVCSGAHTHTKWALELLHLVSPRGSTRRGL